ncbi:MAG: uroporphyrinogen decarboxylase family protein, partial [Spirochaetaceae bacterium]|nr:uroporphyrinogen decarboxylase family protein [Spirochaetaceae bacterium]
MTGKELILKAMNNEELPRVPWVPYTGVQIGQLTGYNATELLQDGEKLYKSLIEAEKQYSPDGMPVIFDLQVEAEVLGCELKWADDSPPTVSAHPLASEAVVPTKMPGKKDGRIPMILDVMKRFRAAAPDTALYGLSCGPFTLASHLRSTNLFMDMYDNPEYVSALLEYCTDVFLTMADYYIEAGMDIVAPVDPLIS